MHDDGLDQAARHCSELGLGGLGGLRPALHVGEKRSIAFARW